LADLLHDDPPDALVARHLRIHPADHRRGPLLRHDGIFAVRLPARLRKWPIRLRRGALPRARYHRSCRCARNVAADEHEGASTATADRGALMATADTLAKPPAPALNWQTLAHSGKRRRSASQSTLLAFLVIVSLPIILPYFWMVVISFTARTGGISTDVLWTACAVIVPAVLIYSVVHLLAPSPRVRLVAGVLLLVTVGFLLAALVGGQLHLANYRFLWRTNIIEEIRSKATAG